MPERMHDAMRLCWLSDEKSAIAVENIGLNSQLADFENLLEQALRKYKGRSSQAAEALELPRKTFTTSLQIRITRRRFSRLILCENREALEICADFHTHQKYAATICSFNIVKILFYDNFYIRILQVWFRQHRAKK